MEAEVLQQVDNSDESNSEDAITEIPNCGHARSRRRCNPATTVFDDNEVFEGSNHSSSPSQDTLTK